eukprot:TRINITY_DN18320_c0_g1_i1.p1 TRINITY_DN18320_c0_g1~~TRINITY_DN18320_c0_g1_i1.p1  ORF type:complete len:658 (-),score=97.15 TRINITY_DN18320_c0_g1_i1:205-2178(-)
MMRSGLNLWSDGWRWMKNDKKPAMTAELVRQMTSGKKHSYQQMEKQQILNWECLGEATLRVLPFPILRDMGHLPRDKNCGATTRSGKRCGLDHDMELVQVLPDWILEDNPIIMVSHIWSEPSGDDGRGRPDNDANRKFQIVCDGILALCRREHLDEQEVHVFMDYWSIPQELAHAKGQAFADFVMSLPAFIAQMSYVIVPLDSRTLLDDKYRVDRDGNPVQMCWLQYSIRGWCRLEMLTGRILAACGTGMRVYRYDVSWPNSPKLVEIPPYSESSQSLQPTGDDAFYTCCQSDHWSNSLGGSIPCDRLGVQRIERTLMLAAAQRQTAKWSLLRDSFPVPRELGGTPLVSLKAFMAFGSIPKIHDRLAVPYEDEELNDKIVFYASHRAWDPRTEGLKYRWMKAVFMEIVDSEKLEANCVYLFIDTCCIDYSALKDMFHTSMLVRSNYVVIFKTGSNSDGEVLQDVRSRAWIRFEMFVPRVCAGIGSYLPVFETRLQDLNSLSGMEVTHALADSISASKYEPQTDDLCPWFGKASSQEQTQMLQSLCFRLLSVALQMELGMLENRRSARRSELCNFSETTQKKSTDRSTVSHNSARPGDFRASGSRITQRGHVVLVHSRSKSTAPGGLGSSNRSGSVADGEDVCDDGEDQDDSLQKCWM